MDFIQSNQTSSQVLCFSVSTNITFSIFLVEFEKNKGLVSRCLFIYVFSGVILKGKYSFRFFSSHIIALVGRMQPVSKLKM